MPARNVNELMEEAKCYACYAPESVPTLAKLALLSTISVNNSYTPWVTTFNELVTRNDFTGTVGFVATVGARQITITQLGVNVVAGGTQTHTLTISNILCSTIYATAPLNFTGLSGFNYVNINPTPPLKGVVLAPGSQFKVYMDIFFLGDLWYQTTTNFTATSAATIVSDTWDAPIQCPTQVVFPLAIFGGLNFKYTIP